MRPLTPSAMNQYLSQGLMWLILLTCSATSLFAQNESSEAQASDSATIVLYRPKGFAGSLAKVRFDVASSQVKVRNGGLVQLKVASGSHWASSTTSMLLTRRNPYKFEALPGETYYLRYRWCYQLFYAVEDFVEVTPDFALLEIKRKNVLRKDVRGANK